MKIITIIGCCVSGMIKSAMITECWTPQSNHRDTFFSIYHVAFVFSHLCLSPATNRWENHCRQGSCYPRRIFLWFCSWEEKKTKYSPPCWWGTVYTCTCILHISTYWCCFSTTIMTTFSYSCSIVIVN